MSDEKKPPFSPGDLVAVYNNGIRSLCRVRNPASEGCYTVELLNGSLFMAFAHPKQMRKLKTIEKPKEFWICPGLYTSAWWVTENRPIGEGWTHVREVQK